MSVEDRRAWAESRRPPAGASDRAAPPLLGPQIRGPLRLGWVLVLIGCAGEAPRTTVIPPPGTPLAIEDTHRLRIGVAEGDSLEVLHMVVSPFLTPGGEVVVPIRSARSIRVFSPEGEHERTLGRPGEGPGEFASLESVWMRGDTIEAFDDRLKRITRFFPDSSFEVVSLELGFPTLFAVPAPPALDGGWVIAGIDEWGADRRDEVVVHRFGPNGSHLNEVTRGPGMERYLAGENSGPDALSPKAVLASNGHEVFVGETLTPRLHVSDLSGRATREIRWRAGDPPSGVASLVQLAIDSTVAEAEWNGLTVSRDRLRAWAERAPRRASTFWGLMVDTEGFIWIRPFEVGQHSLWIAGGSTPYGWGAGGTWRIFTPEGDEVSEVQVPDGLEPMHVTSDAVVGIRIDDLGVESVQVHALRRLTAP